MKSIDGGTTWLLAYSGFPNPMYGLYFISSTTGWACGAYGDIWKTSDGGANWTDQTPSALTFGWLWSIYFTDATHGFAVGSNQSYASTTDGGTNWTISEMSGGVGVWYNNIFFTDANNGWIVGHDEPLRTTDGGANWGLASTNITKADFGNQYMHDVFFTSPSTGYIVGNNGKFAKTVNGGSSWTVSTIAGGNNFFCMSFSGTTGWIAGHAGVIKKTTNSGDVWTNQIQPFTGEALNRVFFYDTNNGWAIGNNGEVLKSSDSGLNWTKVNIGTTNTLHDVYFSSANVGYITGDAAFYYTGDGGATWSSRTFSSEYFSVKFITDNIGWIVGSTATGKIFKTTNRGLTWTLAIPSNSSPLYDLGIVDANTLVAVGYAGSIQRTVNTGGSWATVTSGTNEILTAVSFVNPQVGYICGDQGRILKSTDSGASWTTVAATGRNFTDIHFINETEGWGIAGTDTWHTVDGGVTWTADVVLSNQTLNSIFFPNPTVGFKVGYGGNIHRATSNLFGQKPACANPVNPLMNDIDIPVSSSILIFVWEDGGGAAPDKYKIYLGTDGGGTTTPTNILNGRDVGTDLFYAPLNDLVYNTTYYWQIVPSNTAGDAPNCPIWSFTTRKDINFGGGGLSAPGYFFANSLPGASGAPSQPAYGWIDPVASGHTEITTWISGNSDDGYISANIGFTFPFFGVGYSSVFIGTNGLLTFDAGFSGKGTNTSIPDAAAPNAMIAALLMDLTAVDGGGSGGANGKVYYGTSGGDFVVTWSHVYAASTSDYMTFQVILSSNGDIQMQFNDTESISVPAPPSVDGDALIGIEDQFGSAGVTYRNNGVGGNIFGSPNAVKFGDSQSALPVELSSFSADITGNGIILNWQTATEVNNYGFEIEKAIDNGQLTMDNWNKIGFVNGSGNSNSPKSYSYTDNSAVAGNYSYRLKQIDVDGQFEYSDVVEVTIGVPTKFELLQNYPNPFNPVTSIKFSLPRKSKVLLKVYDILGKEVAELVNEEKPAGEYTVQFNGANLASGVYFYRISTGNFTNVKKLILMK